MMRLMAGVITLGMLCILPFGATAKADKALVTKGVTADAIALGNPSETVIGQPLAYPKGKPVMKAFKITIPPGQATSRHLHEVNIFAYILSGTLEVDYGAKGKKRYGPGQGFMEAVRWCHKGTAVGQAPAVLVALYLGEPSLKNTETCKR